MRNFEFKKDPMSETAPNRALGSIVKVGWMVTGRKDFVLWYLRQFEVKRLRRENQTKCQKQDRVCQPFIAHSALHFGARKIDVSFSSDSYSSGL